MALAQDRRGNERLGHGLVLLCMLVLAFCVTHQLLMASERHATVMGPLHQGAMSSFPLASPAAIAMSIVGEAGNGPLSRTPRPVMSECPAQQAVIPLLLVLGLLVGVLLRPGRALPLSAGLPAWSRGVRDFLLPSLAPARRRALLQVFLN